MSELPRGWAEATLGDLGEWRGGGTPSKQKPSFWTNGDIPWVSPKDMKRNFIDDSEDRITATAVEHSAAQLIPSRSVLVVTRSGILKHTLPVAVNIREITINQDLKALSPAAGIDASFLAAQFRAEARTILAECAKSGTTVDSVDFERLKAFRFKLAPEAEQRRIVAKLNSLLARTARARAELDRVPALVEQYKQALLRKAFTGELTAEWRAANPGIGSASKLVKETRAPIQPRGGREATEQVIPGTAALAVNDPGSKPPQGWAWVPLRRIARQETGHTPSRGVARYWDGDVPWIGIRDAGAHHGKVIKETFQTISEEGLANSSARLLPAGTVCLSRTASVGYVTVMGRDMATSQDFATWTCTPAVEPKFLMYALMAEGDGIRAFGKGSTHTTIYFPEIRALHVCLAPLEEQREIVSRVEQAFAQIERLTTEANAAARLLPRLDEETLAKAFRGELVPQDPDDEPASILLDRIRQERRKHPEEPKRRGRPRLDGETAGMTKRQGVHRPIVEVMAEQTNAIDPELLFQLAGFTPEQVDDFYAELKQAVASGQVGQDEKKRLVKVK